jgi:hypothetical protein
MPTNDADDPDTARSTFGLKLDFEDTERVRDRAVRRGDIATARSKTERLCEIGRELGGRC